MVKKQPRKTAKKLATYKTSPFNFLLIFAVLLGMIAGVFMVKVFYNGETSQKSIPVVTLGTLEYEVKNGKATKTSTPATTSLRVFLEARAANDCSAVHEDMEPSQYSVVAANKDVSQVLLGYGCGDLSSRMFAVRKDNVWQFISPTNQFDPLTNVPECDYVRSHSIEKKIAPVCYNASDSDVASYSVR